MEKIAENKFLSEFHQLLKLFVRYLGVASASIPAGLLGYYLVRAGFSQELSLILSCCTVILILIACSPGYLRSKKSSDEFYYSTSAEFSDEISEINPAKPSDFELIKEYQIHGKHSSEYIEALVIRFYPLICEAFEEYIPNALKRVSIKNIFKETDFLVVIFVKIFQFFDRVDLDDYSEMDKRGSLEGEKLKGTVYRITQRAIFEEMRKPHFSITEDFENREIADKPLDVKKIVSAIQHEL